MKKVSSIVREYINRISSEELRFLYTRLTDGYGGDFAEALEKLSKDNSMDRALSSVSSKDEFFDLIDLLYKEMVSFHKSGNTLDIATR